MKLALEIYPNCVLDELVWSWDEETGKIVMHSRLEQCFIRLFLLSDVSIHANFIIKLDTLAFWIKVDVYLMDKCWF